MMQSSLQVRPLRCLHGGCRSALHYPFRWQKTYSRGYATQSSLGPTSSAPRTRKQITVTNDDGSVQWGELSRREKTARATQQSANFAIIVIGAVMTGGVFTLLYTNVFSTQSKTSHFNHTVERIKDDSRCVQLLGDSKKIKAYGENTGNRWTRNRPIATTITKDNSGKEHLKMHFHVSGPLNEGRVNVHMIRPASQKEYQYQLLAVDVKGHSRIYLENAEATARAERKKSSTIFGVRWR